MYNYGTLQADYRKKLQNCAQTEFLSRAHSVFMLLFYITFSIL
jgi:hypothetical protein